MKYNNKYNVQCTCSRLAVKNSFLAIFDNIPCITVQGLWHDFGATLKIHKKSKFDQNRFKLATQHKTMYTYQEKL